MVSVVRSQSKSPSSVASAHRLYRFSLVRTLSSRACCSSAAVSSAAHWLCVSRPLADNASTSPVTANRPKSRPRALTGTTIVTSFASGSANPMRLAGGNSSTVHVVPTTFARAASGS